MIRKDIERTKIFDEFSDKEKQKYFSVNGNKVIHNIDTLYYSITLDEFNNKNDIENMVLNLNKHSVDYKQGNEDIKIHDMAFKACRFSIYEFCLSIENEYDVFISSYLPNKVTPRIVVQLRSLGLWVTGVKPLIEKSFNDVLKLLNDYSIAVREVKENRIDYAYHTNIIQNTTKYFGDKNMLSSLDTQLENYQKVGTIGKTIGIDYLALGNRKSNNIFFRSYNKTKEVIEKNYKGVFVEIWFKNKLISEYDKYCLEYAYKHGTYNGLILGRCHWYLEFGKNEELKKQISKTIKSCHVNSDNMIAVKDFVSGVLPEVTTIINVEFQTKRKFYMTTDISEMIPKSKDLKADNLLFRLFSIIDNRKSFLNYLTSRTVAFRHGSDFSSWWKRIRSCKMDSYKAKDLYREYLRNLDAEKLKKQTVSKIACNSIYLNGCNNNNFNDDLSDLLCCLNDNDVQSVIMDSATGEVLDYKFKDYEKVKKRKNRQLKSIVEKDKFNAQ